MMCLFFFAQRCRAPVDLHSIEALTCFILLLLWSPNVKTLTEAGETKRNKTWHCDKKVLIVSGGCIPVQSYDFLEFFAGQAWVSTMIRKSGRATAALDIAFWEPDPDHPNRTNHFDILTPAGFAKLERVLVLCKCCSLQLL